MPRQFVRDSGKVGLLSKATEDNVMTYSRAGVAGASQNIFAIDGNTAGAAGIAEMLLQSQGDSIHLLPALPAAWHSGRVNGLCARGGFEVEMRWRSNRLSFVTIRSRQGGDCTLRYKEGMKSIQVKAGQLVRLTGRSFFT